MYTTTSLLLLSIGTIILLGLLVDLLRKKNSFKRDKFTHKIYKSKANNHLLQAAVNTKENKMVAVNIVANDPAGFSGQELLSVIGELGLEFGKFQIFHKHQVIAGSSEILYSLSQDREPGSFNLQTIADENIFGVCLFVNIKQCPISPELIVTQMLNSAKYLSYRLNAKILDHHRQPIPEEFIS